MIDSNSLTEGDPAQLYRDDADAAMPCGEFISSVIDGLSQSPKCLSCKYLYDERGSALFDEICGLREYYPTRTEQSIMRGNVTEIASMIGSHAVIVELGSGSSVKTRLLLDHLDRPRAYLPVDISHDHVLATAKRLRRDYPGIEIKPIVDDFCVALDDSERFSGERVCVYFPGSTIGNFEREAALRLLRKIAHWCGDQGGLLIGFDLQKDVAVIEAAYNDAKGVTAEFSLNLLHRMNREAAANFDVDQFQHVAFYNPVAQRMEIYIESKRDQHVRVNETVISFSAGERIHIESSHKYTVTGFAAIAGRAGLAMRHVWVDERKYFAVMYLERYDTD